VKPNHTFSWVTDPSAASNSCLCYLWTGRSALNYLKFFTFVTSPQVTFICTSYILCLCFRLFLKGNGQLIYDLLTCSLTETVALFMIQMDQNALFWLQITKHHLKVQISFLQVVASTNPPDLVRCALYYNINSLVIVQSAPYIYVAGWIWFQVKRI